MTLTWHRCNENIDHGLSRHWSCIEQSLYKLIRWRQSQVYPFTWRWLQMPWRQTISNYHVDFSVVSDPLVHRTLKHIQLNVFICNFQALSTFVIITEHINDLVRENVILWINFETIARVITGLDCVSYRGLLTIYFLLLSCDGGGMWLAGTGQQHLVELGLQQMVVIPSDL